MATQRHVKSDAIAAQVKTLAGYGVTKADIAVATKTSLHTIDTHYRTEFEEGFAIGNAHLAQSGFQMAVGRPAEYDQRTGALLRAELPPDKSMAIFLHKARLGYRETQRVEHSGPNGRPIATTEFDLSALSDEEFELADKLRKKALKRQADAQGKDPAP